MFDPIRAKIKVKPQVPILPIFNMPIDHFLFFSYGETENDVYAYGALMVIFLTCEIGECLMYHVL